ncbi:MAG TPA: cupin domain-containing protein, partial [Gaiellaceae bacterium]|nr:cupin domain-containing protein [Gaiellaceae bacterium]
MVPEAPLERNEAGLYPAGEGWFVVNARDTQWFDSNGLGYYAPFEGENAGFSHLGFNVAILQPGEPSCMYHAEDAQEDFLVLSGECLLIVEGVERRLRAWDFVHCPSMAAHVFVGAGDGPCVLVGTGARIPGRDLVYPVNDTALRHG